MSILTTAYGLLGDGAGNEWDLNPEYSRAIAELVRDTRGLGDMDQDDVLDLIREYGEASTADTTIAAANAERAIVKSVHAGGVDVSLLGNVTTLSWEQLESLRADIVSVQRKYEKES